MLDRQINRVTLGVFIVQVVVTTTLGIVGNHWLDAQGQQVQGVLTSQAHNRDYLVSAPVSALRSSHCGVVDEHCHSAAVPAASIDDDSNLAQSVAGKIHSAVAICLCGPLLLFECRHERGCVSHQDLAKLIYSLFINWDLELYDPVRDVAGEPHCLHFPFLDGSPPQSRICSSHLTQCPLFCYRRLIPSECYRVPYETLSGVDSCVIILLSCSCVLCRFVITAAAVATVVTLICKCAPRVCRVS